MWKWEKLFSQSNRSPEIWKLLRHHIFIIIISFVFFFLFVIHFFSIILSLGTWLTEPWLYSGPYLSSSTLQFRQSSVPLPVFPWQLLWQQPLLDQPAIHEVTLESPLHESLKRTHLDGEKYKGVIMMITETLIPLNTQKRKKLSILWVLHNC